MDQSDPQLCDCCQEPLFPIPSVTKIGRNTLIDISDLDIDQLVDFSDFTSDEYSHHKPHCKRGRRGPQGNNGTSGGEGPTGPTGGNSGIGEQGPTGEIGPTGFTGAQGEQGVTGFSSADLVVMTSENFALEQMTIALREMLDNRPGGTTLTIVPANGASFTISQTISTVRDAGRLFTYSTTSGGITINRFFSLNQVSGMYLSTFDPDFEFDLLDPVPFSNQDIFASVQSEHLAILSNYLNQSPTIEFFNNISVTGILKFANVGILCLAVAGVPQYYNTMMIRRIIGPEQTSSTIPTFSSAKPALSTNTAHGVGSTFVGNNMVFTGINMNQITGFRFKVGAGVEQSGTITAQSFSSVSVTKPYMYPDCGTLTITADTVSDGSIIIPYALGYDTANTPFGHVSFESLTKNPSIGPIVVITTPGSSVSGTLVDRFTLKWKTGIDMSIYKNMLGPTGTLSVIVGGEALVLTFDSAARTISFRLGSGSGLQEIVLQFRYTVSTPSARGGTSYTLVYAWDIPTQFSISF